MTEPTSSLTYTDILGQVGHVLGFGYDTTAYAADETSEADAIIQAGLKNFYTAKDWSFLHPVDSITIYSDVAVNSSVTVTGTSVGGVLTITATAASFYSSMVGATITVTGKSTYTITGYTSTTVVSAASADTFSGKTFSIDSGDRFRLPDNYAGCTGWFTFAADTGNVPLKRTDESKIRAWNMSSSSSGTPVYAAVRPIATHDPTLGQRYDLLVYPNPDSVYVLSYKKIVLLNKLTSTNKYPLGGALHSETIKKACMAEAGLYMNQPQWEAAYEKALAFSIKLDSLNEPEYIGMNRDRSDGTTSIANNRADIIATYEGEVV